MKLTKKIALVSASLALGMAAPAVLAAENASVTLAATQATAVTVTKKTAPYYHKDGSKFTKAKPYKYGNYSSATTGKGANYKVIKTVTIKGAKYYYIGNAAYLKASDVKVTASKTVKAASSSKKTSTKKTTSKKTAAKSSSKKTAAKKTSTKKAATAKKAAVPAGTATNVTSVTVTKKTTPFYHADGSKFTKAKPYKYDGWTSTVAYKNITFKVSKELTLKGAKYYYIGNNAYLKASDVKVASSKKAAAKKTSTKKTSAKKTSTKKTSAKKTTSTKKTSAKKTTSSKKTSTKKAAKTVAAVKVAKKTVPYYHKDGSKFTKAKPYKYNGWSSTVAYKNVNYNVVKTVTIKGAKYYYIGNAAYLKASDVTVTKTK